MQYPSEFSNFAKLDRPLLSPDDHDLVTPLTLPTVNELINGAKPGSSRRDIPKKPSVEEQLSSAFEEGRKQGVLEGEKVARERLLDKESELEKNSQSLSAVITGFQELSSQGIMAREADLAVLALEIAKEILGTEPTLNVERLRSGIQEALSHIEPEIDVRVRVHPSHIKDLSEALENSQISTPHSIEVVPDGAIELGGAVVEAGPTRIDTQIGVAIERLHGVLFEFSGETI